MTEPSMMSTELDQQIIAASREVIAARSARPRDPARIAAAEAEYARLIAIRDAGA